MNKGKKWFNSVFDAEENEPQKKSEQNLSIRNKQKSLSYCSEGTESLNKNEKSNMLQTNYKNWMKHFDPVKVEDLAVHSKKVQDVEEWLKSSCGNSCNILLLSGPVGCGKTATVQTLAVKHNIKITEWITPLDIDLPSEYGDYEFKEKQSKKFLEFIIKAANFSSLLDNNNNKLVLVEDFPNTFMRTPSEFEDILQQYKLKAKSSIVFICSDCHSDNKNTALNLFTPNLKEQFNIHHIAFNSIAMTGLRAALRRASEIISKGHSTEYNVPSADIIESVVNTSAGDVRSAILNLHFACLKGSNQSLETSLIKEDKLKSKTKKKKTFSKFMSLGKDQTVSILHGVGRVLNPKATLNECGRTNLSHSPQEIVEQFLSNPNSFLNFLEENYLPHFSSSNDVDKAAIALSDADYMLAEWREKVCQEYGLYMAIAGLMLANKVPISAWNPVRGPKNMRVQYPIMQQLPLLNQHYMYTGKVLVVDYISYYKIIENKIKNDNSFKNQDEIIE